MKEWSLLRRSSLKFGFAVVFLIFGLVAVPSVYAACCNSDGDCGGGSCSDSSCGYGGGCPPATCCQYKGACKIGSCSSGGSSFYGYCKATSCNCGSCGSGNGCSSKRPHAPTLVSPPDGSVVTGNQVTLRWNHDGNWGKACKGKNLHFKVRIGPVDGEVSLYRIYDKDARSYTVDITPGVYYEWSVSADNGPKEKKSDKWRFNPPQDVRGYIFETGGDCGEDPASRGIPSVSGQVSMVDGTYPASDTVDNSTGRYEINNLRAGYEFNGLCFSGSVPSGDPDWVFDLVCAQDGDRDFTAGNNCIWAPARVDLNEDMDLSFGYRRASSMDVGWFTSIGGGIFSGGDLYRTVPTNPVGFSGELLDDFGDPRYVFAGGDINVETGGGVSRVGSYGHMESMGGELSFLPTWFSVNPPASATPITTLSNLDPEVVYVMDSSRFDALISSSTLQCSSFISSSGVAVLYVVDDGAPITFDRDFCSSSGDRRLVVITDADVIVTRDFGIDSPTPGSGANLGVYLITSEDVVFEGTSDPLDNPDNSIVIQGGLASLGQIRFERDLGLLNVFPSEVLKYDHRFLYDLTRQAKSSPAFSRIGLFQTSVEWYVSD